MTDRGTDIRIRAATRDDVETLARVGAESFTATYESTTTPEDVAAHIDSYFSAAAILEAMEGTHSCYFIASVDSQPAGLLKLRFEHCPDEVPDKNAAEIQLLYILPSYQRVGLGAQFVDVAIRKARSLDLNGIWLSAWEDADWAVNFYRKVGFRQVGTQPFKVGDTFYNDLLLWLPFD